MQQFKVIYVCSRKTQMLPNMCTNELHLVYIVVQNYAFVHQTCSVVIGVHSCTELCFCAPNMLCSYCCTCLESSLPI